MRRTFLKALSVLGTTGLICAGAVVLASSPATASPAAAPAPPVPDSPADIHAGRYIVLLDAAPVATYTGATKNFRATQPKPGKALDPRSADVQKYSKHLESVQEDVAANAGVAIDDSMTFTLNGFTANLTAEQAQELDGTKGVIALIPDEILHVDAMPSTDFLGLSGPSGVWQNLGGIDAAGEGIVVGVVDSGIAANHPSFAGDTLGTTAGAAPYLDGNDVVFAKSDGATFRSTRVTGPGWDLSEYNTKLVGARFYSEGMAAGGFDFSFDYLSPLDGGGHGSHTASTAAGNNDISADMLGRDFGKISGVAPAAKVAMYKACWEGPDPTTTDDDGCSLTDTMAAINQATADGVDVINYSIGGGAATSTLQVEDIAFFNAAAAGVFVSVSAGNSGPGPSTADHASPWYTTVGASTFPSFEGTATFGSFAAAGASVTVDPAHPVTAPAVYAGDIPAVGADVALAEQCQAGTIDAASAVGKIVVCDRGGNARAAKSETVKEAGGVGMLLINPTSNSLDNDIHAVPTVHIQANFRDEVLALVRSEAGTSMTLTAGNSTGVNVPTPSVAGFSSRGPILADGSDMLKPDIVGPGVSVLAASKTLPGEAAKFEVMSGTSMSSPHVAGLGALYFTSKPNASPSEIKSAMMTTASDTVDDAGAPVQDPFTQGAGQVEPAKMFRPGLVYLNGPADWQAYLQGQKLADFGVEPIDASDLNLPSIAIGSLTGEQKVTRTVTALASGTYTATVSVPGVNATVSPAQITLGVGESATFTVTFSNGTAPVEAWATGFLTWQSSSSTVRSPIGIRPALIDAPTLVTGEGVSGTIAVPFTPGTSDAIALSLAGLAKATRLVDPANAVPGHSGNELSGAATDGTVSWIETVGEGVSTARFDLDSSDDAQTDLDLVVTRVVSPDDLRYYERWASATGSADESVVIDSPTAGTYLVRATVYSFVDPFTWDLETAYIAPNQAGSFAAPAQVTGAVGVASSYDLTWTGLDPSARYWGTVGYGTSEARTTVRVDTPAAAAVTTDASVETRCLGKKAAIAVKVTNTDTVTIDVTIDSSYGSTTKKNIKPGKSAAVTLTTKVAAIEAGVVTVTSTGTIDGAPVTTTQSVAYGAITCR